VGIKKSRGENINTYVKCKSKEHINVHHINNYKQFVNDRLNIDNGICLCKQCHKQIHRLFGLATNQNNLKEFLN
jgi:predicted HNH restriction endonuclease